MAALYVDIQNITQRQQEPTGKHLRMRRERERGERFEKVLWKRTKCHFLDASSMSPISKLATA